MANHRWFGEGQKRLHQLKAYKKKKKKKHKKTLREATQHPEDGSSMEEKKSRTPEKYAFGNSDGRGL